MNKKRGQEIKNTLDIFPKSVHNRSTVHINHRYFHKYSVFGYTAYIGQRFP